MNSRTHYFGAAVGPIVAISLYADSALSQSAEAIQACRDVYVNAVENVRTSSRDAMSYSLLRENMCEGTAVREGFTLSASYGEVLDDFSESFGLSASDTSSKQRQFCENTSNESFNTEEVNQYEMTVVTGAQANFNTCIEYAQRGIEIRHSHSDPDRAIISVSLNEFDTLTLTGISIPSNTSCVSGQVGGLVSGNVLRPGEQYSFNEDFAIVCTRQPSNSDGVDFWPRSSVELSTNRVASPYVVVMPEDSDLTPIRASESKATIDRLVAELAAARAEIESWKGSYASLKGAYSNVDAYGGLVIYERGRFYAPCTPGRNDTFCNRTYLNLPAHSRRGNEALVNQDAAALCRDGYAMSKERVFNESTTMYAINCLRKPSVDLEIGRSNSQQLSSQLSLS